MAAKTRSASAAGFTLTDLVLVLLILAILAVAAAPRFADALSSQRAKAAARRIIADLTYARDRAKFRSASQTVRFDPDANCYELIGVSALDRPGQPYRADAANGLCGADLQEASFGGDTEVVFDAFGRPDSAGLIAIQVGSHRQTVVLDQSAGLSRLQAAN